MTTRAIVVRGDLPSEHAVQFFDTPDTRAKAIADFLIEGYRTGDALLLAISRPHWQIVAGLLRDAGIPVDAASGDVTVLDAREALDELMCDGQLDRERFDAVIGATVRRLAASGRRCRIYGEIVDLLAAEGDFRSVQMLEDLWNESCDQLGFRLFCGYTAANLGDPRSVDALRSICRSHSLVLANSRDLLGSFLATAATGSAPPAD